MVREKNARWEWGGPSAPSPLDLPQQENWSPLLYWVLCHLFLGKTVELPPQFWYSIKIVYCKLWIDMEVWGLAPPPNYDVNLY